MRGAMRCRLRAAHGKAVHARRSRPATLAPKQFRRSPAAANPGPIHPRAAPANRIPQLPLATPAAAIEGARETTLQIAFPCASRGQNPQFPIKSAFRLLGTPSLSQKRHKPANGTEIAQDPETQIRSSAVQGLLFGSSSSVMLRLIGHGVVSEKNNAGEVCRAAFHFVVEMKRGLRRVDLFTF
jgi:hypothetical protein